MSTRATRISANAWIRWMRFAKRIHRIHALALIRVALVDIGFGESVERGDDHLGLEVESRQMRGDRVRQRLDIDWIFCVRRHGAQRRLPAHGLELVEDLVVDGRRGRRGVLRIERKYEQLLTALLDQGLNPR